MNKLNKWYCINFILFYYGLMFYYYINYKLFSQFQPLYLTYNRDFCELFIVPKFLINHRSYFLVLDIVALVFPLIVLACRFVSNQLSFVFGILFSIYLLIYLLLYNIFEQIHLEPTVGYLLMSAVLYIPERKLHILIKWVRLTFLYVLFSAALWKIMRGSVFYPLHMKNILVMQHATYLSNNCNSYLCELYLFLIKYDMLAQVLYAVATFIELLFVVGWFTKKYDYHLVFLAALFFSANYFLMKINYWPIMISVISLLPIPFYLYNTNKQSRVIAEQNVF